MRTQNAVVQKQKRTKCWQKSIISLKLVMNLFSFTEIMDIMKNNKNKATIFFFVNLYVPAN